MKKLLFLFVLLCLNLNKVTAHGFGAHVKHYETIVALNLPGSYLAVITDARYKPYFLYGSIFPDIQYAFNFKKALNSLYQEIRNIKIYQISELNINEKAFDGLTYEIDLNDIPDLLPSEYIFGFDTHSNDYALQFAEYLFTQSQSLNPNVMQFGTGQDQINQQIAFALGYYAHLAEDIVAHNFLVPKITAQFNLGDLELVKNNTTFNEDPNAQMEGIIEALIDHHFGDNSLVAQTAYNDIWVKIGQVEPSVPLVMYDGHVYSNSQYFGLGNPVFNFFINTANQFLSNNPNARTNNPIGLPGLLDLADVFRFANRFYPTLVGKPFNGFQRIDQILADWIANHLDLSVASNAWGIILSVASAGIINLYSGIGINVDAFSGLAFPNVLKRVSPRILDDARSLISLMLSDLNFAEQLVQSYPEKVDINSFNILKNHPLFTNGASVLQEAWDEYKELGARIYAEVGPTVATQNWYNYWSPWRKETMTWGVFSSLNNLLPEIYASNPNVAVYDSYFEIGGIKVSGPQPFSIFQTYSTARINLDIFNTKDVASQSLNLIVKRDHNSTNYGNDGIVSSTGTFSIDQIPINYGSVYRLTKYLDFPVSINDLASNKGYYFELKDPNSNKAIFTSSFEQYQTRLTLTANYYRLYDTYEKYPYSLGVERNAYSVSLAQPKVEDVYSNGSYMYNGINSSSIIAEDGSNILVEAVAGSPDEVFFKWSDGNLSNPRQYQVQSTNSIYAIMKKSHVSNNSEGFMNSSQRKFIKTSDGVMHHVYVSMSRVWYEQSTNNGVTWIIMNDGLPLDNGDGECPSIDFGTIGEHILILIAYQETNTYSQTSLKVAVFKSAYGVQPYELIETETIFTEMIGYRVNPVISIHSTNTSNSSGSILISWQDQSEGGLFYRLAGLNMYGINLTGSNIRIAETSVNSINPASSTKRIYDPSNKFHLVWQENEEIKYCTFFSQSAVATLSTNSGYDVNIQPSIVVLNDNIARIAWVGERLDESESIQRNVVFMAPDNPSHFWTFGNNVSSTNINRPDNVNAYVIGWSEDDGNVNKIVDNHLSQSYIRNLNQVGKDIQICNGATFSQMKATAFNTSNSPYSFNLSNDIQSYYTIPKNTSTTSISEGREGIVSKNKLQFYFGIGDIKVDDELIGFKDIEESVRFSNVSTLNNYLTSKPFQLSDNSSFYYSVQFGITDTSFAQNTLTANSFVTFRVLLVDDNTNQLLGAYDEVTYTLENLLQHKNIGYQVNTTGIGNRTVRLVLEVTDNIEPKYALAEKYADDNVITKEKYETIEYKGKLGITEYALAQNYPNPFNPVTTINYQIPKSGRVVLKVYDILGKEIATPVNEEKEIGRYSVNFDASKLSSGVYLYELVANDYRAVKKLMVIK